jgi:3-oxoacyl-[acyl-carrier-protein] synthase-3
MYSVINNIKIKGMATVLPENIVNNLEYSDVFGEAEVRKQIKVTGISERRCLQGEQTATDLSIIAAKKVLAHAKWDGNEIKVLIYVSAYECAALPSTAYYIMSQIGTGNDCLGFDVNLGCSAFINGLYIVSALLTKLSEGTKGLLIVSDSTSVGGDNADKAVSMLSGDCGTATAVEVVKGEVFPFQQCFDGSRYQYLVRKDLKHNLQMDGMSVFNFAISDVADGIKDYFEYYEITKESIDYYILHQAQKFIVNKVAQFAELPKDKVLASYQLYGNTGGPSLPCTVCANWEKISKKEEATLFFAGFGSGLSWGMVILTMNTKDIIPPAFSNNHFPVNI